MLSMARYRCISPDSNLLYLIQIFDSDSLIFQLKRKKLSLANAVNYTGQGSVSDGFNTSLKNQLKNHLFLESDYIARAVCF